MKSTSFKWTSTKSTAAISLANGHTIAEVAKEIGKSESAIDKWKAYTEFAQEVDRLSLMVGIAGRAERLRLAMRIVRKLGNDTDKDLLDWVKFAQSETDGIKLDLAAILEARDALSVAGGGQD